MPEDGAAQVMGNLGEMNRLEQRAEELAVQADPEGAPQTMGKAAMMAEIISKDAEDASAQSVFHAASLLYRAQEQGLHSMALFERMGGQTPAPAGVCQLMVQSIKQLHETKLLLEVEPEGLPEDLQEWRLRFLQKSQDWHQMFRGLHVDLACPGLEH